MDKENLIKLAKYLLSGSADWDFDMYYYETCSIGHAPEAGVPQLEDEDYPEYSGRVFGLPVFGKQWDWCFSGRWYYHDNTPHGAARRILYLVENGAPPAEWDYEEFISRNPMVRKIKFYAAFSVIAVTAVILVCLM